jgi:hypothetical protein
MPNKYIKRARITEAKFRELLRYFCLDLTAVQITELSGLNRNTVNRYLGEIRKKIARYCRHVSTLSVQAECGDEMSDNCLYGILIKEKQGRIYTQLIALPPSVSADKKAADGLEKHASYLPEYDMLIIPGTNRQIMLHPEALPKQEMRAKMNRIKSFWGGAKARLSKFKGLRRSTYELHMKECEFRYNHRGEELYPLVLKILRRDPID